MGGDQQDKAGACQYFLVCFLGGFTSVLLTPIFVVTVNTIVDQSFAFRSRSALQMTDTELRLIAAPAMIGLSSKPKKG